MLTDEQIHEMRFRHRPLPRLLHGQCVPIAVADCLRIPVHQLPPRLEGQEALDWQVDVEQAFNVRIELDFPEAFPPSDGQPWVAIVPAHTPGDNHALGMIGRRPMRDRDLYPDPCQNLLSGLRIRSLA